MGPNSYREAGESFVQGHKYPSECHIAGVEVITTGFHKLLASNDRAVSTCRRGPLSLAHASATNSQ